VDGFVEFVDDVGNGAVVFHGVLDVEAKKFCACVLLECVVLYSEL
jgi:hypothetical protein